MSSTNESENGGIFFIDEISLKKIIEQIEEVTPGSDINLSLWISDWGDRTLSSELSKPLVQNFKDTIKKYKLKNLQLKLFSKILLFCLPVFDGMKLDSISIFKSFAENQEKLTSEHMNLICRLLKDAAVVESFSWCVHENNKHWHKVDDFISALSKSKIYKLFNPHECCMEVISRQFFHKMLALNNLQEVFIKFRHIKGKNGALLLQRVLNESTQLKKITINELWGFPREIKWLILGNSSNVKICLKIESSGPKAIYPNSHILWPLIIFNRNVKFDFIYSWSTHMTSFSHCIPKYPVNMILSKIERGKIHLASYMVDILLFDDVDRNFRPKTERLEMMKLFLRLNIASECTRFIDKKYSPVLKIL